MRVEGAVMMTVVVVAGMIIVFVVVMTVVLGVIMIFVVVMLGMITVMMIVVACVWFLSYWFNIVA